MSTRYILVAENAQNVAILAQGGKGIASPFEGLVLGKNAETLHYLEKSVFGVSLK